MNGDFAAMFYRPTPAACLEKTEKLQFSPHKRVNIACADTQVGLPDDLPHVDGLFQTRQLISNHATLRTEPVHVRYLAPRRLAACALALLCMSPVLAAERMRVAVQENSAPKYADQLQSGSAAQGICPDLLRAIERQDPRLRFAFEPFSQPLKRIEHGMSVADTEANCLADNAERRVKFHVLPITLFSFNYHLIARADDPVRVKDWDDVRHLGDEGKILVVSGSGVLERLRKVGGLSVEESGKSATANLKKLVIGRGRFFYYRTHDWDSQVHDARVTGQVRVLPARLEAVRFHLMFGRHVDPAVIARASHALQVIEADGTLAKLRVKWHLL